jgi:hypothetical protein
MSIKNWVIPGKVLDKFRDKSDHIMLSFLLNIYLLGDAWTKSIFWFIFELNQSKGVSQLIYEHHNHNHLFVVCKVNIVSSSCFILGMF